MTPRSQGRTGQPERRGLRTTPPRSRVAVAVAGLGACAAAACSSANPTGIDVYTDAGNLAVAQTSAVIANDAGQALAGWPQPSDPSAASDPGGGKIWVTISGEANALGGYPFPPGGNLASDTYMPDGWAFFVDEYLVVVDHVVLWSDPDLNPANQSVHGPQVAHLDGPFVVDLHKGGGLVGQGGAPEEATPIGTIQNQNDNGNQPFDPTTTYGVGFSTVQATYDAYNVNLTADEAADYAYMVQQGYSVMYVGSVEWNGSASPYGCTQTNAGAGPAEAGEDAGPAGDGGYDFTKLPQQMTFRLGFSTPTNYVNCQNETLQGMPLPNEDYPRGIQVSQTQSVFAQVTVHMDHPFWQSFAENSPVHWDQIAAQYVGETNPQATIEDMKGVPFYAFTDRTGTPLPWRNCMGSNYTLPGNGQMYFSTLSVPVDPAGTCTGKVNQDSSLDDCPAIRDYYDYIRYTQSTQGHFNSQGLCFIDRQYPAPAGGS